MHRLRLLQCLQNLSSLHVVMTAALKVLYDG
jgi:hypothetical protein